MTFKVSIGSKISSIEYKSVKEGIATNNKITAGTIVHTISISVP
jgi:hypothetical protein